MKKLKILLFILLCSCAAAEAKDILECDSQKFGKFQWHYDNKKVYEMYPDQPRIYNIDSKFGYTISASSKSSAGMWYAKIDTSQGIVSVQGPYGDYKNINCIKVN